MIRPTVCIRSCCSYRRHIQRNSKDSGAWTAARSLSSRSIRDNMQAVATTMRRVGSGMRTLEASAITMPSASDRAASRLALLKRHLSSSSPSSSSSGSHTSTSPTSSPPSSVSSSQGRSFRFDLACSFLGKGESNANYRYKLPANGKIASWVASNTKKHGRFTVTYSGSDGGAKGKKQAADAGDDFFFAVEKDKRSVICGVTDGVGGWSESGEWYRGHVDTI